ncbi:MAG: polysaccharide deacetylase family protein [Myroides sp.]
MLSHKYIKWFFIALLIPLWYAYFSGKMPLFLIFIAIILWLGITAWGSFDIRLNYFVKAYSSNKKINRNIVALTFDDGPTEITPEILNLLEKYNQKATFFCIGKQVEKHPETAKIIVGQGHVIANHTYLHTNKMGFLSKKEVHKEIASTQNIIQQITSKIPNLFRPPFGVTNPNIARACKENRVEVIGWNVRSLDTVITSEDKILSRILDRFEKGSIILLHDTSTKTLNVLERLLIIMEKKQIQSVTVDELLNIKAYK